MAKTIPLILRALVAGAVAATVLASEAAAQSRPRIHKAPSDSSRTVQRYWTPERLRNAVPLPLPRAQGETKAAPDGKAEGPIVRRKARPPEIDMEPLDNRLFAPKQRPDTDAAILPRQTSLYGAFFTTTRVFPVATTKAYPYSATGKLFFHDPSAPPPGDFICSASVIDRRLVMTAGHCVFDPTSVGTVNDVLFENFLFVPSYDRGAAPFGEWDWASVIIAGAWEFGNGTFPNAQDVALLSMANQDVQGGPAKERIGAVTGTLGWLTQSLKKQHVTMIGWPGNLDAGERMIPSYATAFKNVINNAVEFGSAMKGGSSGGPWVKDFGERSTGQADPRFNLVVSVTSYQPGNVSLLFLGGSILNNSFVQIVDERHAAKPPRRGAASAHPALPVPLR
jgi:V8-like Glu-specific endopeptidase